MKNLNHFMKHQKMERCDEENQHDKECNGVTIIVVTLETSNMMVSQTQTNIMSNSTLLKKINDDVVKIFSHYNTNDSHHIAPTMELYDVLPRCKKTLY